VRRYDCLNPAERANGVQLAISAARRGRLIVFPTDTVYAVACDAFNVDAVDSLNAAKERIGGGGLPVMVGAPTALDGLAIGLTADARALVQAFWPGPLTVVCEQQMSLQWDIGSYDEVAVRMPLHPLAIEVLRGVGPMVVITANRVGGPIPLTCVDAQTQLGPQVEVYLDGGPMAPAPPSTIVDLTSPTPTVLREGSLSVELLRSVVPELALPDEEAS
jgi:L-threonylcarbamoyladenylate synthase